MKNKKTPEIRFAGFNDEWKEKKLGEISTKVVEKNKDKIYLETLTNSAEYGIINQREFFEKNISNEKNLNSYYVVYPDDFVYNPRISNLAPVGPINRNKLKRVGIISPLYYVFRLYSVDKTYIEEYFKSDKWHTFMKLNGDSGARDDRFAIKDSVFNKMPILLPSFDEQTKIGNFFKGMDNIISLHQHELDNLKQMKQGFLQKMFPKEGELVPELRFSGFKEEWEYSKLGECAEFNPKADIPEKFEYVDLESVEDTILRTHRTELKATAPSRAQRLANRGDIFYQTVRPYQKNNYFYNLPFDNYVFSTGYAQIRPYADSYFLFAKIQEEKFVLNVLDRCTGTSYPAINSKELAKINVQIPSYQEQKQIGDFFKQLDTHINLHQQELNLLKQTKKAFLQKMFL